MSDHKPANIACQVFRSSKKDETYLYIAQGKTIDDLPEALSKQFGEPVFVMELELHHELTLSRADIHSVMRDVLEQGFHLQMPPTIHPDFVKLYR